MKNIIFLVIGLGFSAQAHGDKTVRGDVNVNLGNVSAQISVAGKGQTVCASVNSHTERVYLARGRSENTALALAKNRCLADGGSIFCEEYRSCEKDPDHRNANVEIVFDILRENSAVNINFSNGSVGYECVGGNSHTGVAYITAAPTRLEARVLSVNQCLDDGGSIFCDELDEVVCESLIQGAHGEVNVGNDGASIRVDEVIDIFKGLFGN